MNSALQKSHDLTRGDRVRLLSMPNLYLGPPPLTVGNVYTFLHYNGSCVVTTSDTPNETVTYWRERVEKVPTIKTDDVSPTDK